MNLRVLQLIFSTLSDFDQKWVLDYFEYVDFKNVIGFALERRILELGILCSKCGKYRIYANIFIKIGS